MKVDLNKKYKTRSGLDVVLEGELEDSHTYPIYGYITHKDGYVEQIVWTLQGRYYGYTDRTHMFDLVEVQEESPWNNPDRVPYWKLTSELKGLFRKAEALGCRFEIYDDYWGEWVVVQAGNGGMWFEPYRVHPDDLHKVYPYDLTKIDKPFGELDRKTQVSLLESYYLDDVNIEFRTHSEDKWHEIYGNPSWSGHIRYRLKPKDTLHNATVMVSPEGEPKVDTLVVGEPVNP